MTYCLGVMTRYGLVMASDSRTNSGYDQVNICKKMHLFEIPGERAFILLTSGNLSVAQSIITLLRRDFDQGQGLAAVSNMYDAARNVGDIVRRVSELDREALERDDFRFNVHFILGGQIKGEGHRLYVVYPQGNPLSASEDSPFVQIGEHKYGRPILLRGIRYGTTTLEEAAKYTLISLDSTMRSNVTVGPPIDLAVYRTGELRISSHRRFTDQDPEWLDVHRQWELGLRKAVLQLPDITLPDGDAAVSCK